VSLPVRDLLRHELLKESVLRRRHTAIHEAGHCLARWYFGHHTERVSVFSDAEVAAGAAIHLSQGGFVPCDGRTDGYDLAPHPSQRDRLLATAETARAAVARVEMALIEGYAGVTAEAHHRRRALELCILQGGEVDMEQNGALLAIWFVDAEQSEAASGAWRRAGALVRSPRGWQAITAIADALLERGTLSGSEIGRLCLRAYGEAPAFEDWVDHWPPRLDQLRTGFIPPADRLAEAA
jgi:hypothetical protein